MKWISKNESSGGATAAGELGVGEMLSHVGVGASGKVVGLIAPGGELPSGADVIWDAVIVGLSGSG